MIKRLVVLLSHGLVPAVVVLSMLAVAVLPGLAKSQVMAADGPPVEWFKTFGGAQQDYGESVRQTSDGGYVVAGATASFGAGDYDAYLVKTDSSGNLVWQATFGGTDFDHASSVDVTQDGGYILGGDTVSLEPRGLWLVKTDSAGVKEWERAYGGGGCGGVRACSDGGYIIVGSIGAPSLEDVYLVKTDSNGEVLWTSTFGGSSYDYPNCVEQTADGGYVVAGYSASGETPGNKVYLAKTDLEGNLEWQRLFDGLGEINDGRCVKQTDDGGYIVVGYGGEFGDFDMYAIKTDSDGEMVWDGAYGQYGWPDEARCVVQTADGGYVIAGSAYSDYYWHTCVVKTDSSGNLIWETTFGMNLLCEVVVEASDGGYVTAGTDQTLPGNDSMWLAKLSPATPPPNTPVGSPVTVSLDCATVTFSNVTVAGSTSCSSREGNSGGGAPQGFKLRGRFVDIATTATYTGPVIVGIAYDPSIRNPQSLRLFHREGGRWVDVTTWVDTTSHIVYGQVTSL